MGRISETLTLLVLAIAGVAIAAAGLELGVRVAHLEPDRFWEPDPLLGSRHIAGMSGWWTQEEREFSVPVEINAQGWRDVPRAPEKPPGVSRIVVLGDSFAEAMQVPLEVAFPRVLEQELNRRLGRRVEVINMGVSGYGTAGELLLLRRDGARYQPDLVLVAFFSGNDVMNNSPELEDTLIPVYRPDGSIERIAAPGADRPRPRGWRRLLAHSKAYRYARRLLFTKHPGLARTLAAAGIGPRLATDRLTGADGIPVAYHVYGEPDGAWAAAWSHTERLIQDLETETRRLGARLAVMIVSSREEADPARWNEVLQTYPAMQQRRWDLDAPRRRIAALCVARGIPHFDVAPALRAAGGTARLYFRYDGHWTAAGHGVAGRAIAEYLVTHALIGQEREEQHGVY